MNDHSSLAQAIIALNEQEVKQLVTDMANSGVPAMEILNQCHQGMSELGRRFEEGDCFVPELIIAGKIMENVTAELEPLLQHQMEKKSSTGTIIMGTVKNDIHNIGKDIVVMMLRGSGFNVVDLGIDVSPQQFVQAIQEHHPIAIGMSILITTCYKCVQDTVHAIQQAGLRNQISIMVGGAAASERLANQTGCDFYGKSPVSAINHVSVIAHQKKTTTH